MFKVGDIIKPLPSSDKVYGITTYGYVKKLKVTALGSGDFSAVILEPTPIGIIEDRDLVGAEFDGLSPEYFALYSRVKLLSVKKVR